MTVRQQHFLKLTDYTPEEIGVLLDLATELKADKKAGREKPRLCGKNIALIFEKASWSEPASTLPRATQTT